MKYLRYPLLTLVTFIIGVVVSPIHFYPQAIGCGRVTDGGGAYSISSYKSSYFVNLSFAHAAYASTEKANEVFNQGLGEAARVIEVGPKLNSNGSPVGRRAVAIFFEPELNGYCASVFWTDGRDLHTIYSTSFLHAVEFEKHERE
jgi:hypothetical protein